MAPVRRLLSPPAPRSRSSMALWSPS